MKFASLADRARRRSSLPRPEAGIRGIQSLDLIGVSVVADGPDGPVEVPSLSLSFERPGVVVRRSDRSEVASIPWALLRSFTAVQQPAEGPSGTQWVALVIESDRKEHRFLVPNAEATALTTAVDALAVRYGGGGIAASGRSAKHLRRP
jgi:hypothetical protein